MGRPDSIRTRPIQGEGDLAAMYILAMAFPDSTFHLADLPWRFRSPAYSRPERTRLWESEAGELLAWAVLSSAWSCVDDVVRPGPYAEEITSAIFGWVVERLGREAAETGERQRFCISSRQGDADRLALIERHGFTPGGWGYVHLTRDLTAPIPEPSLPAGFTIRPLDGEREVEAYVAMHLVSFQSKRMTAAWRRATLNDPHHKPELDLVAVAPDGTLAGFCVCWITPPLPSLGGVPRAQVEPLGVLPDYRRLGLGRALLNEGARRARALDAGWIDVETGNDNTVALSSYESVGFCRVYDEPFFVREFS